MTLTKNIIIALLMALMPVSLLAQNESMMDREITLKFDDHPTALQVLKFLKDEGINVTYPGDDPMLEAVIVLPKKNKLMVSEVLNLLKNNTPFEYQVTNGYIILKKKELKRNYQIRGKVTDKSNSEPLIGATISIKGSTKGDLTNSEGQFSISLRPGVYTILIRYVGFESTELPLNVFNNEEVSISLTPSNVYLDEVEVTSQVDLFGDMRTGRTIETVSSKTIEGLNLNNTTDALHGRINGVWTTKMSGAPGDHQKIRIRGISSLFGSVDPLYVVDKVPVPKVNLTSIGVADLNSHDVESITVLKDASSTALYGYQGGSGVIIIETKKGGKEDQINFSVKQGTQWNTKRYNLANSYDFLQTYKLSDRYFNSRYFYFQRQTPNSSGQTAKYPEYTLSTESTNWENYLYKMGRVQEYQLSFQGNYRDIRYYLSGNLFNHEGVVQNSSYEKRSFAANIGKELKDKGFIDLSFKTSNQENINNLDNFKENSVLFKGLNTEPSFHSTPDSILDENQRLLLNDPDMTRALRSTEGAKWLVHENRRQQDILSHAISISGRYNFTDNLFANYNSSVSLKEFHFLTYLPSENQGVNVFFENPDLYLSSIQNVNVLNQQAEISYQKELGKHQITTTVGYRHYRDNIHWKADSINGIDETLDQDNIYLRGSMVRFGERGSTLRRINSIVGHLNYNYNQKYFLSVLTNFDHLEEDQGLNTKDIFPSVAATWNIAREGFLRQVQKLDHLNLYYNWGVAGNYPLNGLSHDLYNQAYYRLGSETVSGSYVHNLANHYMKREKVEEHNFGAELSLFETRIKLSANYYEKYNSNLIIQREIPYYYGGGTLFLNIGEMANQGFEWTVDLVPFYSKDFQWQTKFGYSSNNQIIKKLDSASLAFKDTDILIPDFVIEEQKVIGSIYGYDFRGRYDEETFEQLPHEQGEFIENHGLLYHKADTTGEGLTDSNKKIVGNAIPNWTFNWHNIVRYKNLQLEMLWHGVIGVDKYNATKAATYMSGTNMQSLAIMRDSLSFLKDPLVYESSYFVEDASFIRLKTVTLTYEQPKPLFGGVKMRYSISAENLLTLTKYTGYDPEATIYTGNNFSDNALDRGAYPNPKGFYFTINMTL